MRRKRGGVKERGGERGRGRGGEWPPASGAWGSGMKEEKRRGEGEKEEKDQVFEWQDVVRMCGDLTHLRKKGLDKRGWVLSRMCERGEVGVRLEVGWERRGREKERGRERSK